MVTFSTCEGAKSCPDFCGGVYNESYIYTTVLFAKVYYFSSFLVPAWWPTPLKNNFLQEKAVEATPLLFIVKQC
jgi:hypothetical protein